jgi:hypothetical protein
MNQLDLAEMDRLRAENNKLLAENQCLAEIISKQREELDDLDKGLKQIRIVNLACSIAIVAVFVVLSLTR